MDRRQTTLKRSVRVCSMQPKQREQLRRNEHPVDHETQQFVQVRDRGRTGLLFRGDLDSIGYPFRGRASHRLMDGLRQHQAPLARCLLSRRLQDRSGYCGSTEVAATRRELTSDRRVDQQVPDSWLQWHRRRAHPILPRWSRPLPAAPTEPEESQMQLRYQTLQLPNSHERRPSACTYRQILDRLSPTNRCGSQLPLLLNLMRHLSG